MYVFERAQFVNVGHGHVALKLSVCNLKIHVVCVQFQDPYCRPRMYRVVCANSSMFLVCIKSYVVACVFFRMHRLFVAVAVSDGAHA